MKEYRVCVKESGSEHTSAITFRDWGGRQNWQGNATDEERMEYALRSFEGQKRYCRIFYGTRDVDMWLEVREVGPWEEVEAEVSE